MYFLINFFRVFTVSHELKSTLYSLTYSLTLTQSFNHPDVPIHSTSYPPIITLILPLSLTHCHYHLFFHYHSFFHSQAFYHSHSLTTTVSSTKSYSLFRPLSLTHSLSLPHSPIILLSLNPTDLFTNSPNFSLIHSISLSLFILSITLQPSVTYLS